MTILLAFEATAVSRFLCRNVSAKSFVLLYLIVDRYAERHSDEPL